MSWKVGGNKNLSLKPKPKLGLHNVGLREPGNSPEKNTLTSRKATIARFRKHRFKRSKFLSKMDNIEQYEKSMCKLPD